MAIKPKNETKDKNEAAEGTNQASDQGNAGAETAAEPKRRGAPRGKRTTPTYVWTDEMRSALASVLRAPAGPGQIRTAQSVAAALNELPPFEGKPVDPQRVTQHMKLIEKNLRMEGQKPAPWFKLDKARVSRIDTSAFAA